jgi:pyruvate/2-oxoacid:ferredoxin oxidoreductase alpha subunit
MPPEHIELSEAKRAVIEAQDAFGTLRRFLQERSRQMYGTQSRDASKALVALGKAETSFEEAVLLYFNAA